MAFVPVPDTAMVEMVYTQDGQYCENVFHVWCDGGIADEALTDVAEAFIGWWEDSLKSLVAVGVSLVNVRVTKLDTNVSLGIEYATGLPIASTMAQEQLPNNVTVAVKWLTGFRGRSFRGRSYMIGLPRGKVINNQLETAYHASLLTAWGNLVAAVATIGINYELVVVSRRHDNADRSFGISTPVVDAVIDTTVDSQRRRLPGRGS